MDVLVGGSPISEDMWPRREYGLDHRLHDVLAEHFKEDHGLTVHRIHINSQKIHECEVVLHVTRVGCPEASEPTEMRLSHDEIIGHLMTIASRRGHASAEVFYHAGMYWALFRE